MDCNYIYTSHITVLSKALTRPHLGSKMISYVKKYDEVKEMDDIRENTQKVRKIHLSYRQVIFFCLGGLMIILLLIFCAYSYYDHREECRESALQKARDTAENVTVWTDGYFALSGMTGMEAQVSVWKQGVEAYMGRGEGIVVLDGQGQTVFSTDPALEGLCQSVEEGNSESLILSVGGALFWRWGSASPKHRNGAALCSMMWQK